MEHKLLGGASDGVKPPVEDFTNRCVDFFWNLANIVILPWVISFLKPQQQQEQQEQEELQ